MLCFLPSYSVSGDKGTVIEEKARLTMQLGPQGQAWGPAVPRTAWPLVWLAWMLQQAGGKIQKADRHKKDSQRTVPNAACCLCPGWSNGCLMFSKTDRALGIWSHILDPSLSSSVKLSKPFLDVRRTIWRFQYSPKQFYFVKRRTGAPGRL